MRLLLTLGIVLASSAVASEPCIPSLGTRPLDRAEAALVVRAYESADTWTLKAMVLLSLGTDFPPDAAGIVAAALRDKDDRLEPHAVELLRHMDTSAVREVATPELVAELVEHTVRSKHRLVRERALEALARILPEVPATNAREWQAWWSAASATYVPRTWVPPPAPKSADATRTTATSFVERAFDLRDAGLEVAFVIDTTGSMQPAIDAARDAIAGVVALLSNVSPKLRLGLVEYKDLGDVSGGAQVLVPLTRGEKSVHDSLARIVASGGGDEPESVDKGIETALGPAMGWTKEANRLILVIGDAPPHREDQPALLELVKRAHDAPFAKVSKLGKGEAPRTGTPLVTTAKGEAPRPFIVSAIYTAPDALDAFRAIAEAGGGAAVWLDVGRASRGREKPDAGPRGGDAEKPVAKSAAPAVRKIVEHVLLLSFGAEHRSEIATFVKTFFEYLDADE